MNRAMQVNFAEQEVRTEFGSDLPLFAGSFPMRHAVSERLTAKMGRRRLFPAAQARRFGST